MHKVVTERPRHGHGNPSRKWGGRVAEDHEGPGFASSARRRQYGWRSKEFSDFLAPLRRYLRSQVGRPWDKVFSEIRKAVPAGLHGDHLWMHIRSMVSTNCIERDGGVFQVTRYYFGEVEVFGLYVHPRTRLLSFRQKSRRPKGMKPSTARVTVVRFGENEEYRKINGLWFYRKFVRLEVPSPPSFQLVRKKQLNRRELRRLWEEYPETISKSA